MVFDVGTCSERMERPMEVARSVSVRSVLRIWATVMRLEVAKAYAGDEADEEEDVLA